MTGPEHYRTAEGLLRRAASRDYADLSRNLVDAAQVHATLALAAATALNDHGTEADGGGMPLDDFNEWREAVGTNLQRSTS
ncbi:hypothetical protein [Streptomyces sp. 351MFTsu5.1]|uniref:hypothetical protein n=1 Tax=Streptomyces sp. 351MFTsu5.1 TaxID=1172180 RepID=UPI0003790366|nr:hypothetical protein [Streptomyces sp. 351MFTsu5.1]